MKTIMTILAILLAFGCGPKPNAEQPEPEPAEPAGPPPKPHIDVPPLSSYSWLSTANIQLAPMDEKSAMEAKLTDFYSGLPMFMKVVAMNTKDRSVALKHNGPYLTDIWDLYLSMAHQTEDDPPTTLDEFDAATVQWAIFKAWVQQNEHSGVDNYDDAVTSADYGK
jgi:hypothetical protein